MVLTPETDQKMQDLERRLKALEETRRVPEHLHDGIELNRVDWMDIGRRIYTVEHTIYGADAATAANYGVIFIAPFVCSLVSVREVHQTAGSDGGAVTLTIEKLTGTEALDAGVSMLEGTINLKGTANTVVSGTLTDTTANQNLDIGDRIALDDAGTLTAVANVTVVLELELS